MHKVEYPDGVPGVSIAEETLRVMDLTPSLRDGVLEGFGTSMYEESGLSLWPASWCRISLRYDYINANALTSE